MTRALRVDNVRTDLTPESDVYGTPWKVIRAIERRWGTLDVDAAALEWNAKAPRYFGPDHEDPRYRDGLAVEWGQRFTHVFFNPPFTLLSDFVYKAREQRRCGVVTTALLPLKLGLKWCPHAYRDVDIFILPSRLTFVKLDRSMDTARFESMVVRFEPMQVNRPKRGPAANIEWWNWRKT